MSEIVERRSGVTSRLAVAGWSPLPPAAAPLLDVMPKPPLRRGGGFAVVGEWVGGAGRPSASGPTAYRLVSGEVSACHWIVQAWKDSFTGID